MIGDSDRNKGKTTHEGITHFIQRGLVKGIHGGNQPPVPGDNIFIIIDGYIFFLLGPDHYIFAGLAPGIQGNLITGQGREQGTKALSISARLISSIISHLFAGYCSSRVLKQSRNSSLFNL
jgi:hypothetical protein